MQQTESNLFGLDYREQAWKLGPPVVPIIDIHSHINGHRAPEVYKRARDAYGVGRTYTMTLLEFAEPVKRALGDSVRFIAVPEFASKDRAHAHGPGFIDSITKWHARGARIVKFWTAPRGRELGKMSGDPKIVTWDNPWRRKQLDHAAGLGMMFMCHIADPDTWFKTKYADASFFGTKASQYEIVEKLVEEYKAPWIFAHMGGWPEDLRFLSGLLDRHANLSLDTSATKWMVRELSKHPREEFLAFFTKYQDRLIFGSDIVTTDDHVRSEKQTTIGGPDKANQASNEEEAFDLYASRYWALRTLFETNFDHPSPIADGDLMMVEPGRYDEKSSPRLVGKNLPAEILRKVYAGNAARVVEGWCGGRR